MKLSRKNLNFHFSTTVHSFLFWCRDPAAECFLVYDNWKITLNKKKKCSQSKKVYVLWTHPPQKFYDLTRFIFRGDFQQVYLHAHCESWELSACCVYILVYFWCHHCCFFLRLASCVKNNLEVKRKKSISDFSRSLANVACPGLLVAAWHLWVCVRVCACEGCRRTRRRRIPSETWKASLALLWLTGRDCKVCVRVCVC